MVARSGIRAAPIDKQVALPGTPDYSGTVLLNRRAGPHSDTRVARSDITVAPLEERVVLHSDIVVARSGTRAVPLEGQVALHFGTPDYSGTVPPNRWAALRSDTRVAHFDTRVVLLDKRAGPHSDIRAVPLDKRVVPRFGR